MADSNPTGRGSFVALSAPHDRLAFLRRVVSDCLEGVEGDLHLAGDQHPHAARARREAAAYRRLLAGLDARRVVPDPDVVDVITDLAKTIDASNQYDRVLAEHDAFSTLLCQVEGAQS